jgi:oligogalacturonide lyase
MTNLLFSVYAALLLWQSAPLTTAKEPPREWTDPDTGHRVVRLSDEPGSQSLYFHQNAYTPDGSKLIITTPTGLATIDLKTRAIDKVVEGRVNLIMTGRRTGRAYYVKAGAVHAIDLSTKVSTEIATLPPRAAIATVNADETLLAGTITEGSVPNLPESRGRDSYPGKGDMMERRLAARLPMQLFVVDVRTGQSRTILRSTDWLNHLQFSPTDPALLLFCHEGPWHKVDRTWTIRSDGTGLTQIHRRTMNMEIEGHEFFSGDGRHIWYDLQTPRSEVFWLAGYELATGRRTWYHLERAEWSVHFKRVAGRHAVRRRWRRADKRRGARQRSVDLSVSSAARSGPHGWRPAEREGTHSARRLESGEAREPRQARLQPRA